MENNSQNRSIFEQNPKIARKIASEGMILLKNNENVLPFKPTDKVGFVGKKCVRFILGGEGSASVLSAYSVSLVDGMLAKEKEGKVSLSHRSIELATPEVPVAVKKQYWDYVEPHPSEKDSTYTVEMLNEIAKETDKIIVTIKRSSGEGSDRCADQEHYTNMFTIRAENGELYTPSDKSWIKEDVGFYVPTEEELELFDKIEKSDIKKVVVVLNIASVVDASYLEKYPKVKAILLAYLAGMEGGNAVADILCGDVNPSGKLTDTMPLDYKDHPSATTFNVHKTDSVYNEGIFVGYRHFETYAPERVLYPFGFGLSYTTFEIAPVSFATENGKIKLTVSVKNTGKVAGKEVVQVYASAPKGKIEKPLYELRTYQKTKLLEPNEAQNLDLELEIKEMASYSEELNAWVLEKGEYGIFVGNSVRNTEKYGVYSLAEDTITEQLEEFVDITPEYESYPNRGVDKGYTLYDVADGKVDLDTFVRQLTDEELVHLAQGQHPDFARGTGGVGNIKKYGIPSPQTADGPAGIRKFIPTTFFPSPTLVASSWDNELAQQEGGAMATEALATGVDILLAPGLNLHRNPLCGRNFEYYSEDPLLSGRIAANFTKGAQANGVLITIKHLFANNAENNRLENNSIMDERTLREIYLRGFRVAIEEGNPAFVMTSYNLVNGIKTCCDKRVLTGILRGEWGYEGAVMTDWRNTPHLWEEIVAGNNVQMPFGYDDEGVEALEKMKDGIITRALLEENAKPILRCVMKSNRFKTRYYGLSHDIKAGENYIKATETLGVSTTRVVSATREDGKDYFCNMSNDQRKFPSYVYYRFNVEKGGKYKFETEILTDWPETRLWLMVDNEVACKIDCEVATDKEQWYAVSGEVEIPAGEHEFKIMVVTYRDEKFEHHYGWYNPEHDLYFTDFTLNLM